MSFEGSIELHVFLPQRVHQARPPIYFFRLDEGTRTLHAGEVPYYTVLLDRPVVLASGSVVPFDAVPNSTGVLGGRGHGAHVSYGSSKIVVVPDARADGRWRRVLEQGCHCLASTTAAFLWLLLDRRGAAIL